MDILYKDNILIADIAITQAAEHEEELMKSDFVRLSWDSATGDTLPVDSYIVPFSDNVRYRLFEPYEPEQKDSQTYHYDPQFQHPKMYLGKVPFIKMSVNVNTQKPIPLIEWSYTGFIGTLLGYFCDEIKDALGLEGAGNIIEPVMVGEFGNIVSTSFTAQDILSALTNVANQLECEWHIDWSQKTLYFGHIKIDRQELTQPVLEVDSNIAVPSVRNSKEGYWNAYQPQGSSRNITIKASSGENVQANVRLTLNKTTYPDGIIYTDGEGHTLTKAQFDALGLIPYIKSVIYENVYPKLDLFVYDVRYRERYLLDENGDKVIDHYEGTTPVYKRYAVWYFQLAYPTYNQQGKVTGWTRYTIDPETQVIDGKALMGAFQANTRENAETSPLAGQGSGDGDGHYGFELRYHETEETIQPGADGEGDTGVVYDEHTLSKIKVGDYEIVFQQKDDFIIPTTKAIGMIPKGVKVNGAEVTDLNSLTNKSDGLKGNVVNLYNIVMSDDYLVSAQDELKNETLKTIAHDTEDNNTYTFKALETAFVQSNPNLYIGRKVTYRNGDYELETRVMKLVTKLDYSFDQEITVGNEVIKGNQTTMREKVDTLVTAFAQGGGGMSQSQIQRLIQNWVTPRFLSKLNNDTAQGVITFLRGLISEAYTKFGAGADFGDFLAGYLGYGTHIDEHGNIEATSLTLRSHLEVPKLVYNHVDVRVGDEWQTNGAGDIESVEVTEGTNTGIIHLRLLKDDDGNIKDYGTIQINDKCKGIYHNLDPNGYNDTVTADNGKGGRTFAGFFTSFFVIKRVEGSYHEILHYELRPTITINGIRYWRADDNTSTGVVGGFHPCAGMTFAQYSNAANAARQSCQYRTTTYTRMLHNMTGWDENLANIGFQIGNTPLIASAFPTDPKAAQAGNYSMWIDGSIIFSGTLQRYDSWGRDIADYPDQGDYNPSTEYHQDDLVHYDGIVWRCIAVTAVGLRPDLHPEAWIKWIYAESVNPLGHWKSDRVPYPAKAVVNLLNAVYMSKRETSNPPLGLLTTKDGDYITTDNGGYIIADSTLDDDWELLIDIGGITNGEDGENSVAINLTNDTDTVLTDEQGNIPQGTVLPTTTAQLYDGLTRVTQNVAWSIQSATGCTARVNATTGLCEVLTMTAASAEVVIIATYKQKTYGKKFTFRKLFGKDKLWLDMPDVVYYDNDIEATGRHITPESLTVKAYITSASKGTATPIHGSENCGYVRVGGSSTNYYHGDTVPLSWSSFTDGHLIINLYDASGDVQDTEDIRLIQAPPTMTGHPEIKYAVANQGTTPPDTGWQASIPQVQNGQWLWQRAVIVYTDGHVETRYSVSYQGKDGDGFTSAGRWTSSTDVKRNSLYRFYDGIYVALQDIDHTDNAGKSPVVSLLTDKDGNYITDRNGNYIIVDDTTNAQYFDKLVTDGDGILSVSRQFAISSVDTIPSENIEPSHQGDWTDESPAVTEQYPYLWAKETVTYKYAAKTTKYYFVGGRGDNGVDAKDAEWVYVRTTENVAPVVVAESGNDYLMDDYCPLAQVSSGCIKGQTEANENISVRCTDDPQGVDDTWKYEWEIKRTKGAADTTTGKREWNAYEGDMTLHNNYAESALVIDIDNDTDQFGTDSDGKVITQQTRSTVVSMYYGTASQAFTSTPSAALKYDDGTAVDSSVAEVGVAVVSGSSNKKYKITVTIKATGSNTPVFGSKNGLYVDITGACSHGSKTIRFSLERVKSGAKGVAPVIYQLAPTQKTFSFSRDASNNLTPSSQLSQIKVAKTVGNETTILSTAQTGITYKWGFDDSTTAQESNKAIGTSISVSNTQANAHYQVWVELSSGDRETLPIVKDGTNGSNGTSPWFADIDDEMDSVALDASGKTTGAYSKELNVKLWHGSTEESLDDIVISGTTANVTATKDVVNKKVTVSVASGKSIALSTELTFTLKKTGVSDQTLHFVLNGIKPGTNGEPATIFRLMPSVDSIKRDKSGTLTPVSPITCSVQKVTGSNVSTATSSDGTLRYRVDGDITSSSDGTSMSIGGNIAYDSTKKYITVAFFVGSTMVDKERIPIVYDGTDGTSPWYANLDNEMDSIACDKDGHPSSAQHVQTTASMWHGSQKQTSTIKVFDDNTSGYEYPQSGTTHNGITVTWNNNTGLVTVAFASGNTVIFNGKKVFCIQLTSGTQVKAVYFTVNGIRAAKDGENAVILQLLPSVSEIVKKKDGTVQPSGNVTCSVTKNDGGTNSTPAASEYTLKMKIDGGTEQSYAPVSADSVSSEIMFILYDKASTPNVIDRETVPVVEDGTDGEGFTTDGHWTSSTRVQKNHLYRFYKGIYVAKEDIDYGSSDPETVNVSKAPVKSLLLDKNGRHITDKNGNYIIIDADTNTEYFDLWVADGTGENSIRIDLDNENDSMLYDNNGVLLSGNCITNAKLFDGNSDVTDTAVFTVLQNDGATVSVERNRITVSAVTKDATSIVIGCSYKGNTYIATLSIKRLVDVDKFDIILSENSVAYNTSTGEVQTGGTLSVAIWCTPANGGSRFNVQDLSDYGLTLECVPSSVIGEYSGGSATVTVTPAVAAANTHVSLSLKKGYETQDAESIPVVKAKNGDSVIAQYAPNSNPTSSQIHNTWQNGDLYMRTKPSSDSSWSDWQRIVGENGGETDYSFGISKNKTTANASTPPADISFWSDAPQAVTSSKPYLWSKVQKKDGNGNNVGSPSYIRLTGEDGVTYDLTVSPDMFARNADGTYKGANYIYCRVFKIVGDTRTELTGGSGGTFEAEGLTFACLVNSMEDTSFISWTGTSFRGTMTTGITSLRVRVKKGSDIILSKDVSMPYDGAQGIPGNPGAQGLQGCSIRISEWKINTEYRNDEGSSSVAVGYIDIVAIENAQADSGYDFYQCKETHYPSSNSNRPSSTENKWWKPLSNVGPLYTSLLIAKNAYIKFGTGNEFRIMNANGIIQAGMRGGTESSGGIRIWAGNIYDANNNINLNLAPFRVTQEGKLYSTDADVTGKITATSGTIGGFTITDSEIKSTNNNLKLNSNGSATIGKLTVNTNGSLALGSNVTIDSGGNFTANDGTFKGVLKAEKGITYKVTKFDFTNSSLTKTMSNTDVIASCYTNAISQAATLFLPQSPLDGQMVYINNIIAGNEWVVIKSGVSGRGIYPSSFLTYGSIKLNRNASVSLVYDNQRNQWWVFSANNT